MIQRFGGTVRCPNHNEILEDCITQEGKGSGTCPVSGARFEFEPDSKQYVMDVSGNKLTTIKFISREVV